MADPKLQRIKIEIAIASYRAALALQVVRRIETERRARNES